MCPSESRSRFDSGQRFPCSKSPTTGNGWILGKSPRSAAISGIAHGAIMWPAGMLWRRMEPDIVQYREKKREKDLKRLNGAIQVLVIDGVLIVPNSGSGTRYFVAHKQNAVVSRIRFELGNRRALSRP